MKIASKSPIIDDDRAAVAAALGALATTLFIAFGLIPWVVA